MSWLKKLNSSPDVLSLDLDDFRRILQGKRSSVKSFLMNQKYLAGIGNVYSDEILFQSRPHPQSQVNDLKSQKVKQLFHAIQEVLHKAIDAQADPNRFPLSFLLPHRRQDMICPRCQGDLKKISVAGRSAYFCPACQKQDQL